MTGNAKANTLTCWNAGFTRLATWWLFNNTLSHWVTDQGSISWMSIFICLQDHYHIVVEPQIMTSETKYCIQDYTRGQSAS